jgi:hypothetical protein
MNDPENKEVVSQSGKFRIRAKLVENPHKLFYDSK